jgi:hypothetical protein
MRAPGPTDPPFEVSVAAYRATDAMTGATVAAVLRRLGVPWCVSCCTGVGSIDVRRRDLAKASAALAKEERWVPAFGPLRAERLATLARGSVETKVGVSVSRLETLLPGLDPMVARVLRDPEIRQWSRYHPLAVCVRCYARPYLVDGTKECTGYQLTVVLGTDAGPAAGTIELPFQVLADGTLVAGLERVRWEMLE